ncbi:class A beta-lactamase-related serine hydrolase [Aeromicrobium fastidiosum]|uniref:serine hydrolase n=1 Tax=Aeromicrobium fastidiosum TaxID=52699 RepID=UPI0020236599|nr:serine hydrolase [Aeromicrobium fastidiosum]MCL8251934.1 class A beta-lactamase-related serine hydrolase [Aeromicrobium fastidiosum]
MDRNGWVVRLASLVTSAVVVTGVVALTSQDSDAAPTGGTASPAASSTTSSTAAATGSVATGSSTTALDAVVADGRWSVSVLDLGTGASSSYGDTGTFDTASIVKVDILAALLWQHQQDGTALADAERQAATVMIERSDNAAATTLFAAVGGEDGLEAFNERIGLTGTDVGADGLWGLTQTTAADQVRLLDVVLGDGTVLDDDSRSLVERLMTGVVDAQRFGVTEAADDPDGSAVKVGYLQRSTTGLWDVTSIGRVEVDGRTYLVAVLSDGNASLAEGAALTGEVARAAVADAGAGAI